MIENILGRDGQSPSKSPQHIKDKKKSPRNAPPCGFLEAIAVLKDVHGEVAVRRHESQELREGRHSGKDPLHTAMRRFSSMKACMDYDNWK